MIAIEYQREVACPFSEAKVKTIVQAAVRLEKKIRGTVEVTVVSDATIKKINREYRGKDKVTDVISFGWQEDGQVASELLGELYLCYPQIKRQAKEFGVSVKEEFIRMLVHGLLHIAGHDHVQSGEAKKMFGLQEKIIKSVLSRV